MRNIFILFLIAASFFFIGCAKKQMYYWEGYSSSLYAYKKTPSDENLQNHKQVLLEIMQKSEKKGARVPPGVYCEYGYILMKEGDSKEALKYFELEERTYPESRILIQMLKTKLNKEEE